MKHFEHVDYCFDLRVFICPRRDLKDLFTPIKCFFSPSSSANWSSMKEISLFKLKPSYNLYCYSFIEVYFIPFLNMSSFHRPVLQDPVISERSSALISTACRSVENTTTGSRTPAVSSRRGRVSPSRKGRSVSRMEEKKPPILDIQL